MTSEASPRLGNNPCTVATGAALITTTADRSKPFIPKTPSALRIPGFDPSKYGKPKTQSQPQTNEKINSIVSESTHIHSPAAFSTRNDSRPVESHLSSTLPISEVATSSLLFQLQSPSTLPQSSTKVNVDGVIPNAEKQVFTSDMKVQLDEQTNSINQVAISSQTAVIFPCPSTASATCPSPSVQPHTQGRPTHIRTTDRNSSMDPRRNTAHRSGRPILSSHGPHGQETPHQKLQRLKVNELSSIHQRNRRKDWDQTASPATLAALRLPLDPAKEQRIATRIHHYHELGATSYQAETKPEHFPDFVRKPPTRSVSRRSILSSAEPHPCPKAIEPPKSIATPPPQSIELPTKQTRQISTEKSSDYYIPSHATKAARKRNSRWVTNEEIKPDEASEDSNAWGSVDPGEISADSDDSVMALHHGNVRQKRAHPAPDDGLVGWDGKMQPPPIDWDDRPRFDNRSPGFRETFNSWTDAVADRMISGSPDMSFDSIDYARLSNVSYHPDGISMVSRLTTITISNAAHYGYWAEVSDALRETQPLTREELNQVITINTSDPSNGPVLQETTETVVQRWLAHNNINFDSLVRNAEAAEPAAKVKKERKHESNPNSPNISIYLRPAVSTDIPQVTGIYNWHIEKGPRTAECDPIPESDMRARFNGVADAKLPFIVAVMKVKRRSRWLFSDHGDTERHKKPANVVVNNTNPGYSGMVQEEKIVGWACAQDFTCADYVERISAEVEVYVAPEVRRQGVGKCLMDKLMDACDRGHLKLGGYDFDCAPEKSFLYNGGGGRDLHKLYFIFRIWSHPRKPTDKQNRGKVAVCTDSIAVVEGEDEYGQWLKAWLERRKFSVEGYLKQAGAKNGRL